MSRVNSIRGSRASNWPSQSAAHSRRGGITISASRQPKHLTKTAKQNESPHLPDAVYTALFIQYQLTAKKQILGVDRLGWPTQRISLAAEIEREEEADARRRLRFIVN